MTTAAVVAYYRQESEARVSYAGHPPVLYQRTKDRTWSFAKPKVRNGQSDGLPLNIPLAIDSDTLYSQITIPITPGDRLFAYTDGIIDAPNPKGESYGFARLKDTLDANVGAPLSKLKSGVLGALREFTEKESSHDDVTLIVMEIC